MIKKIGKLAILLILAIVHLLGIFWVILIFTEVGMAKNIGIQGPSLATYDFSSIPQDVMDKAAKLTAEMVGDDQELSQDFIDQLLATYLEASDKDVLVVFNSGGWGWNMIQETPGWSSIIDGIRVKLEQLGYSSLVVNYRRTGSGILGCLKEFAEAAARYPRKAQDLAQLVEFYTDNIPGMRVIVAGESTGTVITDETMDILKDKPQVFSIQTGTPFWYRPTPQDRTLLMNTNGKGVDTFSYGNVPAMLWATFKGWLGLSSPNDNPGNILSWLKAPGHDYSWQYPGVYSEVAKFLEEQFGNNESKRTQLEAPIDR